MALISIVDDVETVDEVTDDAKIYILTNGEFKRAPLDLIYNASGLAENLGIYIDEDGDICQSDN